jgi:hypothetical protein
MEKSLPGEMLHPHELGDAIEIQKLLVFLALSIPVLRKASIVRQVNTDGESI